MSSLVEQILDLENEANSVVENARAEARRIEQDAADECARLKKELLEGVERRIALFREQAELRHAQDIAQARQEANQALQALEHIDEKAFAPQVERVVNQFLGL